MFKNYAFQFEDELLLFLCLLSYSLNMVMLVKEINRKTTFADWVLNLVSTFLWAPVAYYTAISWMNIGLRMGLTITITMLSPDITRLILNKEFRAQVIGAIGSSVINGIKSISNKSKNE